MTRKEFVKLTFTLIGGGAVIAAGCDSSSSNTNTTPATLPDASTSADASHDATSSTDAASSTNNCRNPLPETQVADQTGHVHTLTIASSVLSSTTNQTFTTSNVGHVHMVTLTVANLAAISAGGSVTVPSTVAGSPAHMHMFAVTCT